ncbi:MAG: cobalamin B12-binding domain-containing protein [Chloroflexi bacterium]|nr:cobalamin B12-binding domain-containing protein [Chloroflexota bacterium]
MLKITLINPPQASQYSQPPMGLALLAAVLERGGYNVAVVDANALKLKPENIVPQVIDTDVVGLTAMTPTINAAVAIARYLKKADPDLTIILGGAHATLLPEETLISAPEIDVVIRGEGEETVIELLRALEDKQPLGKIPGISYRKDGKVVSNAARATEVDLDSLPFLGYHLLPWQRYKPHPPHGRALPFAAIITSRGCPYQCGYCSKPIFGNKFRGQSPQRVVAEIAYYQDKFAIKEFAFYDDVFTLNRQRAYGIAEELIKRELKIVWTCETRVNLVDKDLLTRMKQAGCYAVAYGIESASPEILASLNKGITIDKVEEAIRLSREVGLQTIGYFMIGCPGENQETIVATIEFAKKLKVDFAQFAVTTPFPGTGLYDLYLKDKGDSIPWENFVYGGAGNQINPVFESAQLSRADLEYWKGRAYREFYLRPAYIWQRLKQVDSIGDLRLNLKGFLMLLGDIKPRPREGA